MYDKFNSSILRITQNVLPTITSYICIISYIGGYTDNIPSIAYNVIRKSIRHFLCVCDTINEP